VEPDKKFATELGRRIAPGRIYPQLIERIKIGRRYDVVSAFHIVEHLVDPARFLRLVKRNIAAGGVIYIEVPNCAHPIVNDRSRHEYPHTHHFTKKGLDLLLRRNGYAVWRIEVLEPRIDHHHNKGVVYNALKTAAYLGQWVLLRRELHFSNPHGTVLRAIASPAKGKGGTR
jgi:hypothetical protein